MKCLITGANGFLGQHLVKRLLTEGYEVLGLDIKLSQNPNMTQENFKNYQIDFTIEEELTSLFKKEKPNVCFHVGAVADLNYAREHPMETVNVNVLGTANVAKACVEYNTILNNISTCCIYGNTPIHPTPEDAPTYPTEIYGCTKLSAEYLIKGFQSLYDLKYNILRPSTIYGEGLRPALATYIFLQKVINNEALPIHGSGRQVRSYIYIGDLIEGFIKLLKSNIVNETFNFAGEKAISVLELAHKCSESCGREDNFVFLDDRPGQVMNEQISIEKAKKVLGWQPKMDFDEGLERTLRWLRSQHEEAAR